VGNLTSARYLLLLLLSLSLSLSPQATNTNKAAERADGEGVEVVEKIRRRGTSLTEKEREEMKIEGLFPPRAEGMSQLAQRHLKQLALRSSNMDKFLYLNSLKHTHPRIFYFLLINHIIVTFFPSFLPLLPFVFS